MLEFDTLKSMLEEWLQFQFGNVQDFELGFTVFEKGEKVGDSEIHVVSCHDHVISAEVVAVALNEKVQSPQQ